MYLFVRKNFCFPFLLGHCHVADWALSGTWWTTPENGNKIGLTTDIYSSLDQTSSLETFENKKPIEENKPTMVDCWKKQNKTIICFENNH